MGNYEQKMINSTARVLYFVLYIRAADTKVMIFMQLFVYCHPRL